MITNTTMTHTHHGIPLFSSFVEDDAGGDDAGGDDAGGDDAGGDEDIPGK